MLEIGRYAAALSRLVLGATAAAVLATAPSRAESSHGAENVLGEPDAPVTVVWYASVTCPHCKHWHDQVWPDFKARYIDTGRVRFVVREMPTAPMPLAMAGFLVARCTPRRSSYFEALDFLFRYQQGLLEAYGEGGLAVREGLLEIANNFGVSEERFEACLRDEAEIARIHRVVQTGNQVFGVTSTPTFIINGVTYGALGIDELAAIIDPLLPG
jgi:protein-disulfide isomerase